ncbi:MULTISPECIES: ATP-binding protein [unclassified Streptomyces]|uniref:ATP-binding protein n=1 Tax=unclassified Streptomyces TaxID=2593676 RepID=UPI001160F860|nr:ATP-binding protein [Streptomyces sp. TSRI0107]
MQDSKSPRDTGTSSDTASEPSAPLDTDQLRRITSLHRGFTYQNLYAVGCLLRLRDACGRTLLVEKDEDVEVTLPGRHLYLQVKTRQGTLTWGAVKGSVERFAALRAEHTAGRRTGTPKLIVVTNTVPGPELLQMTRQPDWPADVSLLWPGHPHPDEMWLPPAAADLDGLLRWCTEQAAQVPFGSLHPQTLVWKLAARMQYASTGAHGQLFHASELADLYEQFVEELQAFPEAPEVYRPHGDEPELTGEQRVRLVTGFSGSGKTTWAAHAAARCPFPVTYFDAAQLPPAAVPGALAREIAARHLSGSDAAGLPNGAGIDVLRAVHSRLARDDRVIAVVVDNMHHLPSEDVHLLVRALPTARITLLGQPLPQLIPLAVQLGITAESLPGWTTDTIATAFAAEECALDYPTAQRVLAMTAGLPLYVLNSALLTRTVHSGDTAAFCDAVQAQTHLTPTAQELILDQTFEQLSEHARTVAALLAIAEVPLSGGELQQLATAAGITRPTVTARAVRELAGRGLTQSFTHGHTALHDALRPLAAQAAEDLPAQTAQNIAHTLSRLLEGHRGIARLARWMRLLAETGQTDVLLELTNLESFYEGGYPRELRAVMADLADDADRDTISRLEAHNALATWAYVEADWDTCARHVHAMEDLVATGDTIGPRERVLLATRQLLLYGLAEDVDALHAAFETALASIPAPSSYERALRYSYAQGLYFAGKYQAAGGAAAELADDYRSHLHLENAHLFGDTTALRQAFESSESPDDYKRLADCYALFVKSCRKLGIGYGLAAFPAMKLYLFTAAWRSAVDLGQDAVETLMQVGETRAALDLLDRQLIPVANDYNLPEDMVGLRSQRAVVLAYLGDIAAARAELDALDHYEVTPDQAYDIQHQRRVVERLAVHPPTPGS